MAMFSFTRGSFEKRMAGSLQDRFVTIVMRNKILGKWAAINLGLQGKKLEKYIRSIVRFYIFIPNDCALAVKIEGDFAKRNIKIARGDVLKKLEMIENRLNKYKVKRSLPKKSV